MKTVYVGLSGGVDSSLSAKLLIDQGYNVVGVYMKNWSKDLPGFSCPWKQDYQDAKRVAVQLGIEFKVFDFEKQYFDKVVKYMIDGFKSGITPNPDIMCNQEIKFKLFVDTAIEQGADMIATGHYAGVSYDQRTDEAARLLKAKDNNKDQTYFLYRMTQEALRITLFPLAKYTKPEVREMAKNYGLATAAKKESMGICFVGKVGIKDFLKNYVETMPGEIIDQAGHVLGEHDGAIFYTIGQRQGLGIGGGLPQYVVGKDMTKNEIYVTTDLGDERLWHKKAIITSAHWIAGGYIPNNKHHLQVRTRHRAPLIDVEQITRIDNGDFKLLLKDEIKALTPGQSMVIYNENECLGGGILV